MTWYHCILKCSLPQHVQDLLGEYLWRTMGSEWEMVRKAFNVVLTSLKESEREGQCINCFRLRCNYRKVCPGWWEVLMSKYSTEKVCRNGSASINSFAKSLAWCSPLDVRSGQKYGGGSRSPITWVLSQLCFLKQESWAMHFHGHHIHLCTFSSDIVVNLCISKCPWLDRQSINP